MDAYAVEAKEKMGKCIESYKNSLSTLRTGRASPAMLNGIEVDYYGSPTPINQISSITVPEPRQLLIKPYDRNDVKNIVAAISASDLGLNPINEGLMVRLIIPALTEERRKEYAAKVVKMAEEAKIACRNARRDGNDIVKKDKTIPEDISKDLVEQIQKATDEAIKRIDEITAKKNKEIMTV